MKPNAGIQPQKTDTIKTRITTAPPKKTPVTTIKPPVKKPVATTTKPPVKKPVTIQAPVKNNQSANTGQLKKTNVDSAIKADKPLVKETQPKITVPKPIILTTRKNELVSTLEINDKNVVVKIYDNGEIDDDTISVYLDNKLVLSKKRLTASALVLNIKMDENNSEHELVMVAENLGRIPPNTSLMIVEAGDKRFDVRITSTEQKNAMVRFKYREN